MELLQKENSRIKDPTISDLFVLKPTKSLCSPFIWNFDVFSTIEWIQDIEDFRNKAIKRWSLQKLSPLKIKMLKKIKLKRNESLKNLNQTDY